jgi:PAS domain S-box-containing protein
MNDARLQASRPPHFRRLSNSSRYDLAEEVQRSHLVMMEAQKIYGYTNIELFDAVGQRVDQVGFESISVEGLTSERVSHLLGTTEPQLIDIFKTGNPAFPFSLAFAVAIHDPEKTGTPGVGFVVLHVDPEKYLYPLIQNWPVPSETAESLLIRRDGEDVLFLNELRHTKSPPLTIRIPLANTEVPAVQAILNGHTEVSGADYRNVPVFSETQVIRNSPWFIVAKVDQSEVLAGLRSMSLLVLGLVLLVVAITGLLLLLNYRQRQRNQEQEFTEELGKREQRFKDFSESSADWFWETDTEHRFTFLSSNATQMLGGRQVEELIGHSRMELAKEDGLYLFNLWEAHAAILAQRIPFRNFEYSLLDGDGQHAWLSVSGVPFVDMVGEFAGYRGVGQVVTARHKAEDELARHRQSLELLVEHRTAELVTTESQMRGIIDASGDGIIEVDRVGNVLLANPAACKILGYPAEELLGCKLHEKIHHSHQDGRHYLAEHCPTAQAIASGGTLHGMEDVFWHADGSPVFVSISVQTINSGDEIVGGVVNFTDISTRKDAEKIIKESDAFKTAILDAMPAHIAVLDRNGIIVTVNAPWVHFSDVNRLDRGILSGDSQIGTNYLDICLRCVGDSVDDAQEAHDGIKAVLEGRSASFNLQYRCHSAQEDHWYSMSVSPLGMPLQGVVISHTNITDQKLAEARRTLLEYALDQVDEGAYLMNQFGSFDYVNEGAARQLGYTREELLNMDVWEIDRDLPKSEWPALWAKIRKNKTVTLETQHWKKDGSVMPVDINANHLLFENHDYSLALARDITKHKEMQEQQKAAMKAAENLARVKRISCQHEP